MFSANSVKNIDAILLTLTFYAAQNRTLWKYISSKWEKIMLDIYTAVNCVIEWKMPHCLMKSIQLQGIQRYSKHQSEKMMQQVSPFFWKFHCSNFKCYSVVCMTPRACMPAWQHWDTSPWTACIFVPHESRLCCTSGGTQDPLHQCRVWQLVQAFLYLFYLMALRVS